LRIACQCSRKGGAVSFCMGRGMAVRTAVAAPGRVGAVASLYDGPLVTGDATSPIGSWRKRMRPIIFAIATDEEKPQTQS
jgi:carboxymethylenebutenolidase